jgi:ribonuclease HI
MSRIYINTDGGSRGNPGLAAIGICFFDDKNNIIYRYKEFIGQATNNEAEYTAIIRAIELLRKSKWIKTNGEKSVIVCRLDSELVAKQLNGSYKIKNHRLQKMFGYLQSLLRELTQKIEFHHIARGENKIADKLVNEALDEYLKNSEEHGNTSQSHNWFNGK